VFKAWFELAHRTLPERHGDESSDNPQENPGRRHRGGGPLRVERLAGEGCPGTGEGGVTAAEITFTVPDALEVIRQVRRVVGDAIATGDFTRMRELACQYAAIVARVRETR